MNITSENRRYDLRRFHGGRGYGSGSGSVIRERRKRGRFSGFIRSEGPRRQMQDFESWMKGELLWRNRNFYRTEGDADFRERVSRSIWPSKLCLSCDKFLPARVVLSFGGKVRLLLYVFAGWGAVVFCRKSSLLATFLNAAFAGDLPA